MTIYHSVISRFSSLTIFGLLTVFILVSCSKEECAIQCHGINSNVTVNQDCQCDCLTNSGVLVSGPKYHYCLHSINDHVFDLPSDQFIKLGCGDLSLTFLYFEPKFSPFTGLISRPIEIDSIIEESILIHFVTAKGSEQNIYEQAILLYGVTQNKGDRSELILYPRSGVYETTSSTAVKPIYFNGCENIMKPTRAKGYFDENKFTLELYFYMNEEAIYNYPEQYLYSEKLIFERKYNKRDLEE